MTLGVPGVSANVPPRPSGVEKDPRTNKNVGGGRKRNKSKKQQKMLKTVNEGGHNNQFGSLASIQQVKGHHHGTTSVEQVTHNDSVGIFNIQVDQDGHTTSKAKFNQDSQQTFNTARFAKKRRSMQPSVKSKASLAKSPSQKSEFSLYGLTQHNALG